MTLKESQSKLSASDLFFSPSKLLRSRRASCAHRLSSRGRPLQRRHHLRERRDDPSRLSRLQSHHRSVVSVHLVVLDALKVEQEVALLKVPSPPCGRMLTSVAPGQRAAIISSVRNRSCAPLNSLYFPFSFFDTVVCLMIVVVSLSEKPSHT